LKSSGNPRGTVAADGRFVVTTVAEGDGAPPGKYIVLVLWSGKSSNEEEDTQTTDVFAGRYATPEKSTLRTEVIAGQQELPRLDITSGAGS
jgi:hypothetical protein